MQCFSKLYFRCRFSLLPLKDLIQRMAHKNYVIFEVLEQQLFIAFSSCVSWFPIVLAPHCVFIFPFCFYIVQYMVIAAILDVEPNSF